MIEDEAVFSVLSRCFAPVSAEEWTDVTKGSAWSDFLDGVRSLVQDDRPFGSSLRASSASRRRCPLQEFISAGEVSALFSPPSPQEKNEFAALHFTGGLPGSALPIESLYSEWNRSARGDSLFPQAKGLYWGDSARYMKELIGSMGFDVPEMFAACPDHLSLELDLIAIMLRSGMNREAQMFLGERLEWLTGYRMRLLELGDDAHFYIGLVDVIMAIRAQTGVGSKAAELA